MKERLTSQAGMEKLIQSPEKEFITVYKHWVII